MMNNAPTRVKQGNSKQVVRHRIDPSVSNTPFCFLTENEHRPRVNMVDAFTKISEEFIGSRRRKLDTHALPTATKAAVRAGVQRQIGVPCRPARYRKPSYSCNTHEILN
ncbi:hypothetical protein PoB_002986200 [Plakobranchus ocellatus]|uniref:Uncharacterized protein n=1 Tax=Plakobranchus ocellatus TaxID=259542 RepID=A0AAV4A8Y3_9GAST|nr:hypothetical protein PoB_002986200 [Plakobranchus ocellatus]